MDWSGGIYYARKAISSRMVNILRRGSNALFPQVGRRFRHPVLLRRHRRARIVRLKQQGEAQEHKQDILHRPKMHRREENPPERPPPGGQSRLHGRCPDLASEFQRPMQPTKL
jgi:hypothetical protein